MMVLFSQVCLMPTFFINESAYYEGGVAMVIARRKTIEIGIHDVPVSSLL